MALYDDNFGKCSDASCNSSYVTDEERGEVFCEGCGTIMIDYMPDISHDTAAHTAEEFSAQTRTGPRTSIVMHDNGLSTIIGNNRDSGGNTLSIKTKNKFTRLRMWDQRSKSRSAATLSKAFTLLHSMKTKLAIPNNVVERAAYIYRKTVSAGLTRGRTITSLTVASLYIACRESDTPRTLDDMLAVTNVERKVLLRDVRVILKKLDIRLNQYEISSFVTKIANNINLSEITKRHALDILVQSEKKLLTAGKHPMAMAAAAIYIACLITEERVTQRTLSRITGVSDVTIRNGVVLMQKKLDIDGKISKV